MEIRLARPEDAPTLGRMGATLARLHNRMDRQRFFASRGMEEGYASWLASELASRKAVVLAAIARSRGREQIVGYAYGRLEGRDWNTLRDAGGVGVDLYVVPRARRRGAGRLLLDALLRELVRRGAPIRPSRRSAQPPCARDVRGDGIPQDRGGARDGVHRIRGAVAPRSAPRRRQRPA